MSTTTHPYFWQLKASDRPAILLPDGKSISYARLGRMVEDFADTIRHEPGPIAILCDGHYRQYVAYLAALSSGCPVLLMSQNQTPDTSTITLKYAYSPTRDDLRRQSDTPAAWHPDLAVLLSTSGTTGSSKWVRLSYANIAANAASIAEYLTLSESDRAPMALPFQYSYGMSIVNSHMTAGASIALLDGSVVDDHFWSAFQETHCTSFAGVPHSFELMERSNLRTDHLEHLRYMTQAGGRLGVQNVESWVKRGQQEGWDFFVMYGQTEAAPRISYLPPNLALESPSSIGIPVPGGSMWVESDEGAVLPDGQPGELCYRGPNTMMGYAVSDGDLSAPQGPDILKTGDVARRLPNGAFEIVGRISRFVKLFGLRISLDEVEKHLTEDGYEAVCIARDDVLHIVLSGSRTDDVSSVLSGLGAWLDLPPTSFNLIPVEALPRQSSGKVDLRAVAALVENMHKQTGAESAAGKDQQRGLFSRWLPRRKQSVVDVFSAHFAGVDISDDASFVSLGGDSLSYVAISIDLEDALGHLPREWPDMTIRDLQVQSQNAKPVIWMDTPTLLRALAIMLIVSGHFSFVEYGGGGARTLFMIAGVSFAAFTLPQVLKGATVLPIAILGVRIACITFFYTLLNFTVTGYGEWPAFLFVGNWISPKTEGSAWFIEVYLQMLIIVAAVLAIPWTRSAIARAPFNAAALTAFLLVLLAAASDQLVDTHHLLRRLPHLYAWIFLTGLAFGLARTGADRLIVTGVLCLGIWQFGEYGNPLMLVLGFFPLAALTLIWVPSLPVPKVLALPLRSIAGASLLIYLSHFQFASVSNAIFGDNPAMSWLAAILGGTLAWKVYERGELTIRSFVSKSERRA